MVGAENTGVLKRFRKTFFRSRPQSSRTAFCHVALERLIIAYFLDAPKVIFMSKTTVLFCSFVCAATTGLAQGMFTPIGNLNQTFGEDIAVWSGLSQAASFKTGDTAASLFSVSVAMDSRHQFSAGNFNLALYSDAGGAPGSSLATLSGNAIPFTAGIYTYTNDTPLVLSPNTTYWVVASSPTSSTAAYQWVLTFSSSLDSGSFWTMGAGDYNQGSGWQPIGSGYFPQFSVTVTNPQPPALSISQPIVLTFPTNGFPFVLQATPNLATTNWTAVTNVILSGVISNQTVFIVPSTGSKMFFRLSSQ